MADKTDKKQELKYEPYFIYGINNSRKTNFEFLSQTEIVYISGLRFFILDIALKRNTMYKLPNSGGIGGLAIHPSRQYFAIAEKGSDPKIYIYSYPSVEIIRTLHKGTEKGFAAVSFSQTGESLASVGGSPDYSLVIWDWRKEQLTLRTKAFSQDVYTVEFSSYSDSTLVTSGMAHLKFWKIANTFTGLKLKGETGKFGTVELSDVCAFAILKDGKVISGCDNGDLLLWEGNFIKTVLKNKGQKCHNGSIELVKLLGENLLITGGADSYLRIWDIEEIDRADGGEILQCDIKSLRDICIGKDVRLIRLCLNFIEENLLYINNVNGSIFTLKISNGDILKGDIEVKEILFYNSSKITGLCDNNGQIIYASNDGRITEINPYEVHSIKIDQSGITALTSFRDYIVTGNSTGVVRLWKKQNSDWICLCGQRVFDSPVEGLGAIPKIVAAYSKDQVFVLRESNGKLNGSFLWPHNSKITRMLIREEKISIGLQNGEVKTVRILEEVEVNNEKNFIFEGKLDLKESQLTMMTFQKPQKNEDDIMYVLNENVEFIDCEWESRSIRSIVPYMFEDNFECQMDQLQITLKENEELMLVSSEQEFIGYIYILQLLDQNDLNKEKQLNPNNKSKLIQLVDQIRRPLKAIRTRDKIVSVIEYSKNKQWCMWGYEDGVLSIRKSENLEIEIGNFLFHDQQLGRINFIYQINENIVTCSDDNSIVFSKLDKIELKYNWKVTGSEFLLDNKFIEIESGYSLQQEKIQAVEDKRKQSAEQYKADQRSAIENLRVQYRNLVKQNEALALDFQVPYDLIEFSQQETQKSINQANDLIEEAEKEESWETERSLKKIEKLKKVFMDQVSTQKFGVGKLQKRVFVYSFRGKKLTEAMLNDLSKINDLIENEGKGDDGNGEEFGATDDGQATKQLLEVLADIKARVLEGKNTDQLQLMKTRIKEECREFSTVEKLQELKIQILGEISGLKKNNSQAKNVDFDKRIQYAKTNFGNYVLKSNPEFKVSEEGRITAKNYEVRILLLEKLIYNAAKTFNESLNQLCDEKNQIILRIKKTNLEIEEVNNQLGIKEEGFIYQYSPEIEEANYALTVRENEFQEYLNDKENEKKTKKKGVFGEISEQQNQNNHIQQQNVKTEEQNSSFQILCLKTFEACDTWIERKNKKINPKLQISEQKQIKAIRLIAKKGILQKQIKKEMDLFDSKIDVFLEERRKLEYELKMGEMRINEMFREMLEITVFEEQDEMYLADLMERREILKEWNEKKTINTVALRDLSLKEKQTESEIREIEDLYKDNIFPQEPEKADYVFQYFKANFKKSLEKNQGSTENLIDFEYNPANIEVDKKELVLFVEGNEDLIEIVRKRNKLDYQKGLIREDRKMADTESEKIEERIKGLQKSLMDIKQNIDDLQLMKMKRINKLNCTFILSLNQILLHSPIKNFNSAVLFTQSQLKQLQNRIQTLNKECELIVTEKNQLVVSQDSLIKQLNTLKNFKKIAKIELKESFELKFGEVINLKILDDLKPTKKMKELKNELNDAEKNSSKKIEETKKSLKDTRKELIDIKSKNTEIIKRITVLGNTQVKLNKALDSTNKEIFKDQVDENLEANVQERKELVIMIKKFNTDLDMLRNEIQNLKKKNINPTMIQQ